MIFNISHSTIQGNINRDLDFESTNEATAGCGVTFMGEFWYFGDSKVSRIISQLQQ